MHELIRKIKSLYTRIYIHAQAHSQTHSHSLSLTHTNTHCMYVYAYINSSWMCARAETQDERVGFSTYSFLVSNFTT
jgi:hypothetical protein